MHLLEKSIQSWFIVIACKWFLPTSEGFFERRMLDFMRTKSKFFKKDENETFYLPGYVFLLSQCIPWFPCHEGFARWLCLPGRTLSEDPRCRKPVLEEGFCDYNWYNQQWTVHRIGVELPALTRYHSKKCQSISQLLLIAKSKLANYADFSSSGKMIFHEFIKWFVWDAKTATRSNSNPNLVHMYLSANSYGGLVQANYEKWPCWQVIYFNSIPSNDTIAQKSSIIDEGRWSFPSYFPKKDAFISMPKPQTDHRECKHASLVFFFVPRVSTPLLLHLDARLRSFQFWNCQARFPYLPLTISIWFRTTSQSQKHQYERRLHFNPNSLWSFHLSPQRYLPPISSRLFLWQRPELTTATKAALHALIWAFVKGEEGTCGWAIDTVFHPLPVALICWTMSWLNYSMSLYHSTLFTINRNATWPRLCLIPLFVTI